MWERCPLATAMTGSRHYCLDGAAIEIRERGRRAIYFSPGDGLSQGDPHSMPHWFPLRDEQAHHGQTRDDVFLCIPPLTTGAKMLGWQLLRAPGVIRGGGSRRSGSCRPFPRSGHHRLASGPCAGI